MDHEVSRCFINTLVTTFREPGFDIEHNLKFVEYDENADSFRMRFELFDNSTSQQPLAAWTITLERANDSSHLEDHYE